MNKSQYSSPTGSFKLKVIEYAEEHDKRAVPVFTFLIGLVWSGPPSFVSSSGPSSPNGMSDIFSSRAAGTSESSEMSLSASLISNEGYGELTAATLANIFPPVLDRDLSDVGILLEGNGDFYPAPPRERTVPCRRGTRAQEAFGGDSGDVTPVSASAGSEFDFQGATTEPEATVIETKQGGGPGLILGRKEPLGLGNKLVGQWVLESSAALCGAVAEEEERTITSAMTATSPARKTIFQVFGSPVSRQNLVVPIKEDSGEGLEPSPLSATPSPSKKPLVSSFTKLYTSRSPQSDSSTESSYKSIKDPESVGRAPANFSCFGEDTSTALAAGLAEEGFGSLSRQQFDDEDDRNSEDFYEEATPILTLASSLTDAPSISRGFNIVKDNEKR